MQLLSIHLIPLEIVKRSIKLAKFESNGNNKSDRTNFINIFNKRNELVSLELENIKRNLRI